MFLFRDLEFVIWLYCSVAEGFSNQPQYYTSLPLSLAGHTIQCSKSEIGEQNNSDQHKLFDH
jgi:hypothetical protein